MMSGFSREPEQVAGGAMVGERSLFQPAETLSILYESKPEAIAKVLSPPLKPYEKPYVIISYTHAWGTRFASGHREAALCIPAVYDDTVGTFIAAMTLDADPGVFRGLEQLGYPQTAGTVDHSYRGDEYVAYSARNGIAHATLRATLDGEPDDPSFLAELSKITNPFPDRPGWAINWTFKWPASLDQDLVLQTPYLVKGWKHKADLTPPIRGRLGKGEVTLLKTEDDPWADLEVIRVLGAVLVETDFRTHSLENEYISLYNEPAEPLVFFG